MHEVPLRHAACERIVGRDEERIAVAESELGRLAFVGEVERDARALDVMRHWRSRSRAWWLYLCH
eukprot:6184907-Pleurochrysis_carterae.AAC.6